MIFLRYFADVEEGYLDHGWRWLHRKGRSCHAGSFGSVKFEVFISFRFLSMEVVYFYLRVQLKVDPFPRRICASTLHTFQTSWANRDCWPLSTMKAQVERGSLWMECSIPKKRVAIFQSFWKVIEYFHFEAIFSVAQLLMAVVFLRCIFFRLFSPHFV